MSSEAISASVMPRGERVSLRYVARWKPLGLVMVAPAQHLVQALPVALLERATTWQIPANFSTAIGALFYPESSGSL